MKKKKKEIEMSDKGHFVKRERDKLRETLREGEEEWGRERKIGRGGGEAKEMEELCIHRNGFQCKCVEGKERNYGLHLQNTFSFSPSFKVYIRSLSINFCFCSRREKMCLIVIFTKYDL